MTDESNETMRIGKLNHGALGASKTSTKKEVSVPVVAISHERDALKLVSM